VYGGNNWYYAYGKSSHGEILEDSRFIASLAPAGDNRPFMVIDEGWALPRGADEASLWQSGNGRFPDMGLLAGQMKNAGVRPGIWLRPLSLPDNAPDSLCLPKQRFKEPIPGNYLDPSLPEALAIVRADIAQQVQWGHELIKHDFTTFDLLGRWGFEMGGDITNGGWRFSDPSKTTAEVIGGLYRTIGEAAGGALLIGCNTVGHIGAGIFHMQRTGDDTSGRQWERTRKMGVNTLAFAMPKHGAFYASDADCAGITDNVPWELNRQWLTLLANSGTPLFVSASPGLGMQQKQAIREAFATASRKLAPAEPLDWMETTCPRKWNLNGNVVEFRWNRQDLVEFLRP
jgi:alpha-galactosidase